MDTNFFAGSAMPPRAVVAAVPAAKVISLMNYGRGRGFGRVRGVGVTLGAGVGVAVGVAVGVGVGVGLGATGTIA